MTKRRETYGAQRLDYSEAEQLLRGGATQEEVAAKFGVSQSAVSAAISRGRIKFDTGFRKHDFPWVVKREHANLAVPRMLRLAMRVQNGEGEEMSERLRSDGEGFLRKLAEFDAVVHYEPDVEPYWFRVQRRPGVDSGLVREPGE